MSAAGVRCSLIGLLLAGAAAAPAADAVVPDERCYEAKAGKRKTSLGVHQWTARQEARWCAKRRRGEWHIVSVDRRATVGTGTNWRLISRSGEVRREGATAIAESRFHFRLRYPYFEQSCYPRIRVRMWPSGRYERSVRTGC